MLYKARQYLAGSPVLSLALVFRIDPEVDVVEREFFTVMNALSLIGGLSTTLSIAAIFLVSKL
jgi:hypothetical protein